MAFGKANHPFDHRRTGLPNSVTSHAIPCMKGGHTETSQRPGFLDAGLAICIVLDSFAPYTVIFQSLHVCGMFIFHSIRQDLLSVYYYMRDHPSEPPICIPSRKTPHVHRHTPQVDLCNTLTLMIKLLKHTEYILTYEDGE